MTAERAPETSAPSPSPGHHPSEPHHGGLAQRLNWLRAGVLGANDGIVSVAAVVVGVAGATTSTPAIFTAGVASLVGGAVSMALGEYVSVSSQRDSELALIAKERRELVEQPEEELAELAAIYEQRGLSQETAHRVAVELTAHNALRAHLDAELNLDEDDIAHPGHAAAASAIAFVSGAVLPLLVIMLTPADWRVPATFVAVLLALALTGTLGAQLGGSPKLRAAARVVIGGAIALAATYAIGTLLSTTGAV